MGKFPFVSLVALLILSLTSPTLAVFDNTLFQARCSDLKKTFKAENTTIIFSEYIPAGTNITNPDSCTKSIITRTDICRLKLNVTTSISSSVLMEVWMPTKWKNRGKRYHMSGNGSWGGCIHFADMAVTSELGFAAVGHNNGHEGNSAVEFRNPEIFKDWIYRSIPVSTEVTKEAVEFFYGLRIKSSYFSGCSTGGRQALKVAEENPELFDGIIASCPAGPWPNLGGAEALYALTVGLPGSPTFLDYEQWLAVEKVVFEQCDEIDGVRDQVIEDPMKCNFRPEAIMCASDQTWETHQCLTPTQVQTVRRIYEPSYGKNGRYVFPRIAPGSDQEQGYWGVYGPKAGSGPQDFFRHVIYNNPSYTIAKNFTLDHLDILLNGDWFGLAGKNDLTSLKTTGHKLLLYQGLADPLVNAENSYEYYESVSRNMSLPSKQLDPFFRFFPVSGLAHCAGGKGAAYLADPLQASEKSYAGALDKIPFTDGVLMRMAKWVEQGIAPETVKGRKVNLEGKVLTDKEHCKYPLKNTYKGSGDPNQWTSWLCE